MKSKRFRTEPDPDDWRYFHEQLKKGNKCNRIRQCPKPGCGKPGCMTQWLEKDPSTGDLTGFKVLVVMHAHHLYPTFEQRRNYNHVVKDFGRVRFHPDEIRRSVTLNNARQLPDYVLAKFGVNFE